MPLERTPLSHLDEASLSEVREGLEGLAKRLNELWQYLDVDEKAHQLQEVELELQREEIWQDSKKVKQLNLHKNKLASIVNTAKAQQQRLQDGKDWLDLAQSGDDEEQSQLALQSAKEEIQEIENHLSDLEFKRMFSGKMDECNAFLDIQAGSGGTEAQDWAQMLFRMYVRFCESKGFEVKIKEVSDGEVAGVKSATLHICGEYAYGWLKSETGIHRLVRKSPFDSNHKRHTSFAGVFVCPEVDENIEIDINPADLRIDTFRASGAGGQHVNKTDSAVRITHKPTNTVAQCQDSRSQHANRDSAMKQLRSKLYEIELSKQNAEKQRLEDSKSDVGWGSQIRSYVLDQSRIKDLRTQFEHTNPQAVLDGDLQGFIEASLKLGV